MELPNNNSNDEGYDENLFLSPPADYLRCGICSFVLYNPIQILDCGHKFCHPCFQRFKASTEQSRKPLQCPIDRNVVDMNRVFDDVALKRLVGSLHVRCLNFDKGCEWTGDLSELHCHAEKCRLKCHCDQQQVSLQGEEMMRMLGEMSVRIEHCENLLTEKDKEISHLKFTVGEIHSKYDAKIENFDNMLAEKDKDISNLKFTVAEIQNKYDAKMAEVEKLKETTKKVESLNHNMGEEIQKEKEEQQSLAERVIKTESKISKCSKLLKKLSQQIDESQLEHALKRYEKSEAFKRRVILKLKNSVDRICYVEEKVEHIEEAMKITSDTLMLDLRNTHLGDGDTLSNKESIDTKCLRRHVATMQPRGNIDHPHFIVWNDNLIEFFGEARYATVTLPQRSIGSGVKAFYEINVCEIDVVKHNTHVLSVGWASTEFSTSENGVGCDEHSYSFRATVEESFRRHKDKFQSWGKPMEKDSTIIIGAALDMIKGEVSFGINGEWDHPMGLAFDDIDTNKEFFPALTFGFGEIQVNFGDDDFVHGPPDDSYVNVIDCLST